MTPEQAAYRAGCIFCEVEARFAGRPGLSPAVFSNCATLPARLPVFLRHLWPKAVRDPAVLDLLDGWECPDRPFSEVEKGPFHIGYYHQRTARTLPPTFPEKLKSLREAARLGVAELAEAAGLSRQTVYQYEVGERRPTWDNVQQLAKVLGVPTDTFRDGPG